MNKRKTVGLLMMLLASAFFIFGSYWYMDLVYSGDDLWPIFGFSLGLGIPATIILILTWRFSKLGSVVGIVLGGLVFCLFLMGALFGDMEERFIRSLAVSTGVYFTGAILVLTTSYSRRTTTT